MLISINGSGKISRVDMPASIQSKTLPFRLRAFVINSGPMTQNPKEHYLTISLKECCVQNHVRIAGKPSCTFVGLLKYAHLFNNMSDTHCATVYNVPKSLIIEIGPQDVVESWTSDTHWTMYVESD